MDDFAALFSCAIFTTNDSPAILQILNNVHSIRRVPKIRDSPRTSKPDDHLPTSSLWKISSRHLTRNYAILWLNWSTLAVDSKLGDQMSIGFLPFLHDVSSSPPFPFLLLFSPPFNPFSSTSTLTYPLKSSKGIDWLILIFNVMRIVFRKSRIGGALVAYPTD